MYLYFRVLLLFLKCSLVILMNSDSGLSLHCSVTPLQRAIVSVSLTLFSSIVFESLFNKGCTEADTLCCLPT